MREKPITPEWSRALDDWSAEMRSASRSKGTIATRTDHLRRCSRAVGVGPWDVTANDLITWTAAQTWTPATRRSIRASLRGFYEWATRTGRCTTSPADVLPKVREPDNRPRPTPDKALTEALMRADHRVRLMIELGTRAGLRRAEVARIHVSDLIQDLDGWSLLVHGKGNRRRIVPLVDDALADRVRAACEDGAGYAFPGKIDGHLSPRWVGKLVAEVLPDDWTMHSLRHRFATKTWRATNDLLAVQQLLGHTTPTITQRYVDVDRARLRTVAKTAA